MVEIEVPSVEELEEKAKSNFTKRIALFTAIFAVFLAITALGGNNASKEMLLTQQEAHNEWTKIHAQAKKMAVMAAKKNPLKKKSVKRSVSKKTKKAKK